MRPAGATGGPCAFLTPFKFRSMQKRSVRRMGMLALLPRREVETEDLETHVGNGDRVICKLAN